MSDDFLLRLIQKLNGLDDLWRFRPSLRFLVTVVMKTGPGLHKTPIGPLKSWAGLLARDQLSII